VVSSAVAKSSLNFVCAALGSDIARLPVFNAVRDFVRGGKDEGCVHILLGDEAESARKIPGFLCKPGHHANLFCGGTEPPVGSVSLYARPFAIVRIATARFTSPTSNVVALFDYKNTTHELSSYVDYYHRSRTHLSLDNDCPDPRPVMPPRMGRVSAFPQVSGLHHRYERLAA
jgi:hypothetical protein